MISIAFASRIYCIDGVQCRYFVAYLLVIESPGLAMFDEPYVTKVCTAKRSWSFGKIDFKLAFQILGVKLSHRWVMYHVYGASDL